MSEADQLAEYIKENYGTCTNESGCKCLVKKMWLGTLCSHWVPLAARNWNEYMTGTKTANAIRKRHEG